ncbi:hypothetical protein GE061_016693 [Apolygus lucorum]|uniref:PHD-type domain-containing protein n=1 Tax=Apolygus lucorum TaxID=248454 RepID=A0A8S9XIZ1_APOLU|nr:hypothetical protein GE061_016693 [Apolygus lucorum]
MSGAQKCCKCAKGFAHNAYKMKCEKCKGVFHLECVKFSKEEFLFFKEKGKNWLCQGCEKVKRQSMRIDSIEIVGAKEGASSDTLEQEDELSAKADEEEEGEDLKKIILSFRREVTQANKDLRKQLSISAAEIKNIKEHLSTYSDYIKENTDAIMELRAELGSLREQNEILSTRNNLLENKIQLLESQFFEIEQDALAKTVEISGIAHRTDENIVDIVKAVGRAVVFDVNESMLDNCFRRRPSPRSNAPGVISVSFVRKLDKEAFVSAARMKRNLSTTDIGINNQDASNRIYVNQSLTFNKRQLLNRAKAFKRDNHYKFVWIRNGRVMIRKDENSTIHEVKKQEELADILLKNDQSPRR